jgi:hypothetical protein
MQDPETRVVFLITGQKLSTQKNGKGLLTLPVFLFVGFYRKWAIRATLAAATLIRAYR